MSIDGGFGMFHENAGAVYNAREYRRMWRDAHGDAGGVVRPTHLRVTQRGAGANMSVDVATGGVLVPGSASDQGLWFVHNEGTVNVAIAAADPTNPRIDRVVVRVRDTEYGDAADAADIFVVTGTPAGVPAAPATPARSYSLGTVAVAALATSITNANITDTRLYCPMDGKIVGVPTPWPSATLPAQAVWADQNAISRTTFADLFALIGTTFGVGDGSTTFNKPDLRGRTIVGLDNIGGSDAGRLSVANTLGGNGGEQLHTMTVAELVLHAHTTPRYQAGNVIGGAANQHGAGNNNVIDGAATTNNQGSTTPFNVMQPYMLFNYIIWY